MELEAQDDIVANAIGIRVSDAMLIDRGPMTWVVIHVGYAVVLIV